jgi:tRNA (guanosine-2'-O-)-methyltransferase
MNDHLKLYKQEAFELFSQYITPERKAKIERNVQERTHHVAVVLEDIFQAHNTSAVLRSAECFGVQNVHIIEQQHRYTLQESVAKGAAQWLNIKRYRQAETNNTQACFDELKKQGYVIAATTPHEKDMLISQLPLDKKVALVFGTEQEGLSSYALDNADLFVKIPMYGFTESFNISVSAAICLYDISQRLRESSHNWRLSEHERLDLMLDWLGRATYRTEHIKEFIAHKLSEK